MAAQNKWWLASLQASTVTNHSWTTRRMVRRSWVHLPSASAFTCLESGTIPQALDLLCPNSNYLSNIDGHCISRFVGDTSFVNSSHAPFSVTKGVIGQKYVIDVIGWVVRRAKLTEVQGSFAPPSRGKHFQGTGEVPHVRILEKRGPTEWYPQKL